MPERSLTRETKQDQNQADRCRVAGCHVVVVLRLKVVNDTAITKEPTHGGFSLKVHGETIFGAASIWSTDYCAKSTINTIIVAALEDQIEAR